MREWMGSLPLFFFSFFFPFLSFPSCLRRGMAVHNRAGDIMNDALRLVGILFQLLHLATGGSVAATET